MIGILDYGMGNLKSVFNALDYLGYDAEVISNPEDIISAERLIIPGVGSFKVAMENLHANKLVEPIKKHIASGKPTLGICLGMQILASSGDEGGTTDGLGIIDGRVKLLELDNLTVPHVGWNNLHFSNEHPVFEGIKKHVDFYFVHSYHFDAVEETFTQTTTEYDFKFTSTVAKENVIGVQFHPEKSQDNGLLLLENFCEWNGLT